MRLIILICSFLFASASAFAKQDYVQQAERAATNWIEVVDKGDAKSTYNAMSGMFAQQLSPQDWDVSIQGMHMYFGKPGKRTKVSATYKTQSYGAPAGDYVDIVFNTDYENAAGRKEVVTMVREGDGAWKVAGFSIE